MIDELAYSETLGERERERERKSEVRKRGERYEGMCKPICTLEICCVRVLLTDYHAVMEKGAYISMQMSVRSLSFGPLSQCGSH